MRIRFPHALATLALTGALALAGCGGDDGGDEPSALAEQFLEGVGYDIPVGEAECAVQGMVDQLGVAGVARLGADESAQPTPDELARLSAVLDRCISERTVEAILLEEFRQIATEDAATCAADEVSDEISFGDLMRIGVIEKSDPDHPDLDDYARRIQRAVEDCG
jgi:hypothetical protein